MRYDLIVFVVGMSDRISVELKVFMVVRMLCFVV